MVLGGWDKRKRKRKRMDRFMSGIGTRVAVGVGVERERGTFWACLWQRYIDRLRVDAGESFEYWVNGDVVCGMWDMGCGMWEVVCMWSVKVELT